MSHARPERRKFLRDIGGGMLLAGLGTPIVNELELASADVVSGDAKPLTFGKREPLVRALEETPVAVHVASVVS